MSFSFFFAKAAGLPYFSLNWRERSLKCRIKDDPTLQKYLEKRYNQDRYTSVFRSSSCRFTLQQFRK